MKVPFYYSFKEFKENYETDLKKWLEVYTEGEEKDFLNNIDNVYGKYYQYNWCGVFCGVKEIEKSVRKKYIPDKFKDMKGWFDKNNYYEDVHIRDIISDIDIRIMTLDLSNSENLNEINDKIGLAKILKKYGLLDDEYNSQYIGGYNFIDFNLINSLEIFWEFKKYDSKNWCLSFNHIKYDNFKLSIPKIYNFIQEKLNPKIKIETQTPLLDEVEPVTLPENIEKIQINGNYQMLTFLFRELIEKGYINAPQYNGKISHKKTAEMILKHFEFTNKEEQPSIDNLTNYIKNNTYSISKQNLFKIPSVKIAND